MVSTFSEVMKMVRARLVRRYRRLTLCARAGLVSRSQGSSPLKVRAFLDFATLRIKAHLLDETNKAHS